MKKTILLAATMLLSYAANAITLPTWKEGDVYLVKVKNDFFPEDYGLTPGSLRSDSSFPTASFNKKVLEDKAREAGKPYATNAQLSQFLLDVSVEEFIPINANSIGDDKGTMYFFEGDLSRYFFIEARNDGYNRFENNDESSVNPFKTTGGLTSTNYFEWGCEIKLKDTGSMFEFMCQMVGTEYWKQHYEQQGVMAGAFNYMATGETLQLDHDCANSLLRSHYVHLANPTKENETWAEADYMKNVQTYFYSPKTINFDGYYPNTIGDSSPKGIIGIVSAELTGSHSQPEDKDKYTHTLDFTSSMGKLVGDNTVEYKIYATDENGNRELVGTTTSTTFTREVNKNISTSRNITYQVEAVAKTKNGSTLTAKSNEVTLPVPAKDHGYEITTNIVTKAQANDGTRKNTVTNTIKWTVSDNVDDIDIIHEEFAGDFVSTVGGKAHKQWRYDYFRLSNIKYVVYEEGKSEPVGTVDHVKGQRDYEFTLNPENYVYGAPDPNKKYRVEMVADRSTMTATGKAFLPAQAGGEYTYVYDGSIIAEHTYPGTSTVKVNITSESLKADYLAPTVNADAVSYTEQNGTTIFTDNVTMSIDTDATVLYYEVYNGDTNKLVGRAAYTSGNPEFTSNVEGEFTDGSKTNKYFGHVVTLNGSTWGCGPAEATHTIDAQIQFSTEANNSVDGTDKKAITFGTDCSISILGTQTNGKTVELEIYDNDGTLLNTIDITNNLGNAHDPLRIIYDEEFANKTGLKAKVVMTDNDNSTKIESAEVPFATKPVNFSTNSISLNKATNYGNAVSAELDLSNAVSIEGSNDGNDYTEAINGYKVSAKIGDETLKVGNVTNPKAAFDNDSIVVPNNQDNVTIMMKKDGSKALNARGGFTVDVTVTPQYNVTKVATPTIATNSLGGGDNEFNTKKVGDMTAKATFGLALAVDTIDAAQASVTGGNGAITISGSNAEAKVFDFNGKLIYKGFNRTINCEAGIYVVALSNNTYKVVVF